MCGGFMNEWITLSVRQTLPYSPHSVPQWRYSNIIAYQWCKKRWET